MSDNAVMDRVGWVLRAGIGPDVIDGYIVMDYCVGYAEPGYGSDEAVIVFGNWNSARYPHGDDPPLTKAERLGPRLAQALEHAGAEIEWYDEWVTCGNCYRAMRSQGDSYSWTMYGAWSEEMCEYTCADCMVKDFETYIGEYINNERQALTWCERGDLTEHGFTVWEPDDEHVYENGWHTGQDDRPDEITAAIRETSDDDIVFFINGVGQFDMRFTAWTRPTDYEEE